MGWSDVRQLTWCKVVNEDGYGPEHTFVYGADGIRYQKNNITYTLDGDRILKETDGTDTLIYHYGTTGVIGFNYNGTDYYYCKNMLGDVLAIYNTSGKVVARYRYDAWGSVLAVRDYTSDGIGTLNPFRYHSYYYDVETKLYYIDTRYYDPETGRFIQTTDVNLFNKDIYNKLNLYTYANNNPLNIQNDNLNYNNTAHRNTSVNKNILSNFSVSTSKYLPHLPTSVETKLDIMGAASSFVSPIRSAIAVSIHKNLWDVMRIDGITELPGILSDTMKKIGLGISFLNGLISAYEKHADGAGFFSAVAGGAIDFGLSFTSSLAVLKVMSLVSVGCLPGGMVILGGAIATVILEAGLEYLVTEVEFFGNTLEGHLNDFLDWLIWWD